jgi:Ca2+-binding EF-hand superfamily protein
LIYSVVLLADAFMIFDFDQDGFLNQKELGRILRCSYMAARDDQIASKAAAILRQADENKDNNLSFGTMDAVSSFDPQWNLIC